MRKWNLKPEDPLALTLAADARLGSTDYCNDQIWELSLGGGDPPALGLHTTFGLRARALRLFPRFTEGDQTLSDPQAFAHPPVITHLYPNFLVLHFSPFADIDVEAGYWVPHSQGACGRLEITNHSDQERTLRLEWVGQLSPTEGERMAPVAIQAAPVLAGQTAGLQPVVFLTGGPQLGSGSYPALIHTLHLAPGVPFQVTWAAAALADQQESFQVARALAARKWDAELARVELLNAGLVDVYTGNPDWDAAFALAQKQAFGLLVGPTEAMPAPSFVLARQPDQGNSLRGDGTDYNHLWNGQPPLEAYYLASLLLPSGAEQVHGLLRNYLAVQAEDGIIDWKPGLARQRSRLLATPLLASITWRLWETTGQRRLLEETFPALLRFVRQWFTPDHDRDEDGVPEWDHPMQAGLEDHPVYSRWQEFSQGVDIFTAEGPALCAFLYRECQALLRMAQVLDETGPVSELQALSEGLRTAVEIGWDADRACYQNWDRDTHFSAEGEWLGQRQGSGWLEINRAFEHPVRLLINVRTSGDSTRRPQVILYGAGISGQARIERLTEQSFKWYLGRGVLTGERVYASIERVEIQGLDPEDEIVLQTAGYRSMDQSLLLPLWANIPTPERAAELVQSTITNPDCFWRPHGLPLCCKTQPGAESAPACSQAFLPWNQFIGEGLVQYGYRQEAAELVTRLMAAIVPTLKSESAFRRTYDTETGRGHGERNALAGLAPLGLFLETLGVRLISPHKVFLTGFNPYPWPVTVKYRGMTILRQKEKSMVIFPDGQTVVVDDPGPRLVSLENS